LSRTDPSRLLTENQVDRGACARNAAATEIPAELGAAIHSTPPSVLRRYLSAAAVATVLVAGAVLPRGSSAAPDPATAATIQHLICRMVDRAAEAHGLPSAFLTRVLWQESRFRPEATSPKGAEGVAQFMPQTAAERGLTDPRDPAEAVVHAARFLVELQERFGNLGLAAAAYNAGPARVARWLQAESDLPSETRNYVVAVTGRPAEDWAALRRRGHGALSGDSEPCVAVTAQLAKASPGRTMASLIRQVRLDGTLAGAIRELEAMARHRSVATGSTMAAAPSRPMSPAARAAAAELCDTARALGTACAVYER